eukprot:12237562-Alexandrium_andersonii.AAC.1
MLNVPSALRARSAPGALSAPSAPGALSAPNGGSAPGGLGPEWHARALCVGIASKSLESML